MALQLQLQFIMMDHVLYIRFLHLCCELRGIWWRRLRCKQQTLCGEAEPEICHTGDGRADITSSSRSAGNRQSQTPVVSRDRAGGSATVYWAAACKLPGTEILQQMHKMCQHQCLVDVRSFAADQPCPPGALACC